MIRGTGARGREVIGYDKEFDIMSDNGLLPPAEIDADGNLRVYHDAQIGARVIVRVKCGFLEYAVIYEVQYPISFSSQIDSDMTFRILYDNLGEVQYDPTSTIEWIAYTVKRRSYSAANNSDERRFIFFAGIPRFKFL